MSTAVLTEWNTAWSPRARARAAGVFWLMNAVTGTLTIVWTGAFILLIASALYVGAALFVYQLMKPVNRDLSLLSAYSGIAGAAIGSIGSLSDVPWGGVEFIFFGLHCGSIGYLILKSSFLPKVLGVLMVCSSLGWLTFSFSNLFL